MKNKISIILIALVILMNFNVFIVRAQSPDVSGSKVNADVTGSPKKSPPVKLDNPIKADSVEKLLLLIADLMIFIGTIVATLMFMWIGFKFVMARGNESELKEAKNWFLYAVIGTAILLGSRVIVDVIENTLVDAGVVNQDLFKKN